MVARWGMAQCLAMVAWCDVTVAVAAAVVVAAKALGRSPVAYHCHAHAA